jgi:AraC-like DNA-binding protein
MPLSGVRTFTDPDDYATAIRATKAEMTVTGRGQFSAQLTRIDLHRLWLQRFSDNLPRIAHSASVPGRAIISFRTKPGPNFLWSGAEMHPTTIMRHSEGGSSYQRTSGLASWGAMSLPVEAAVAVGETLAGCDLRPPRDGMLVTPPPAAMERLQRLHATAGDLAEKAPEVLVNPDAARGLEQALIAAMVECLAHQEQRETSLAQGQHAIVMRRFRRLIEENPEQPLYLPEICEAIRVPDRTLRRCCQEHLGMGPKHYLLLRRLHLVRRALRQATPETTTTTEIATGFGFWQLGRLAVEYQSLFGESPSATLRRSRDNSREPLAENA